MPVEQPAPEYVKRALSSMGMGEAFSIRADFSPLGSHELFFGDVIHKTRIEVDEEGTVAAAATAILAPMGLAQTSVPRRQMLVNRPFGLLLVDRRSEAILFAGIVYEP